MGHLAFFSTATNQPAATKTTSTNASGSCGSRSGSSLRVPLTRPIKGTALRDVKDAAPHGKEQRPCDVAAVVLGQLIERNVANLSQGGVHDFPGHASP